MYFYRRKLPHWQPPEAEYFITARLSGTIPRKVIEKMNKMQKKGKRLEQSPPDNIQRKIFQKYESILDGETTGPTWLKRPEIAKIVTDAIHYRSSGEYELYAYSIMSNHIHLVFRHLITPLDEKSSKSLKQKHPITDIMGELKRYTANKSNKILKREGAFWQSESYDRVIRDRGELKKIIHYTLNNPVKAGLVNNWRDWKFSYCKPEWIDYF